jgi:hypothetical protein
VSGNIKSSPWRRPEAPGIQAAASGTPGSLRRPAPDGDRPRRRRTCPPPCHHRRPASPVRARYDQYVMPTADHALRGVPVLGQRRAGVRRRPSPERPHDRPGRHRPTTQASSRRTGCVTSPTPTSPALLSTSPACGRNSPGREPVPARSSIWRNYRPPWRPGSTHGGHDDRGRPPRPGSSAVRGVRRGRAEVDEDRRLVTARGPECLVTANTC